MKYTAINFKEKFSKFDEHWFSRVIAEMNDYQLKQLLRWRSQVSSMQKRWVL